MNEESRAKLSEEEKAKLAKEGRTTSIEKAIIGIKNSMVKLQETVLNIYNGVIVLLCIAAIAAHESYKVNEIDEKTVGAIIGVIVLARLAKILPRGDVESIKQAIGETFLFGKKK